MSTSTPSKGVYLTKNDPGAAVSRYLICLHKAQGRPYEALAYAEETCRRTPIVAYSLKELVAKAAVGASTTVTDAAPYGIAAEAFLLLQSATIFGRLSPLFRRVPWRVKAPKETGAGGTGAWRGEGLPSPILKTTTDTFQLDYFAGSVIVAVTDELFRFGAIAEATLRAIVIAAVARWIDAQLLDPTVAATSAHPASLTYGCEVLTSAGTGPVDRVTNLLALIAATTSPLDRAVIVCQTRTYLSTQAALAGLGYPVERGYLMGIPVIAGSTSPHQIALIDCENVAYASDDTVVLDVSKETSLQMDNSLTQNGVTGTGSATISLYQSGLTAIRADLAANYQHVHFNGGSPTVPSGAAVMAVAY